MRKSQRSTQPVSCAVTSNVGSVTLPPSPEPDLGSGEAPIKDPRALAQRDALPGLRFNHRDVGGASNFQIRLSDHLRATAALESARKGSEKRQYRKLRNSLRRVFALPFFSRPTWLRGMNDVVRCVLSHIERLRWLSVRSIG